MIYKLFECSQINNYWNVHIQTYLYTNACWFSTLVQELFPWGLGCPLPPSYRGSARFIIFSFFFLPIGAQASVSAGKVKMPLYLWNMCTSQIEKKKLLHRLLFSILWLPVHSFGLHLLNLKLYLNIILFKWISPFSSICFASNPFGYSQKWDVSIKF